jgi:hypothetical protein
MHNKERHSDTLHLLLNASICGFGEREPHKTLLRPILVFVAIVASLFYLFSDRFSLGRLSDTQDGRY